MDGFLTSRSIPPSWRKCSAAVSLRGRTAAYCCGMTRRRYSFREYLSPNVLTMTALGFSSGLPFLLVGNTFGYWLRDEGTTLAAIGFISWVGIAYSLKFLWAPFLDRTRVPLLGRLGRGAAGCLLAQIIVGLGLVAMAVLGTGAWPGHAGRRRPGGGLLRRHPGHRHRRLADRKRAPSNDELGLLTSGLYVRLSRARCWGPRR